MKAGSAHLFSQVWAKLQSLCLAPTDFINVPPLLDPSWGYNSPSSSGTICQCNVVAYNLMVSAADLPSPIKAGRSQLQDK